MSTKKFNVGDWVEVRSKEEILRSLDQNGQLDGMPFMPEMFAYCGRRFQVYRRAHKSCDTVFPVRSRKVDNAVHLETRCDGSAHGGCQAGCLLFWKMAWLKRVTGSGALDRPSSDEAGDRGAPSETTGCSELAVEQATRVQEDGSSMDPTYVCQATRLPYASADLSPYDVRQYIEDYTSGNVGLARWVRGALYISYQWVMNLGIGIGEPLRWMYDRFQSLWGGLPYPRHTGKIPVGKPTPTAQLGLQAGDWVRVKTYDEILSTCAEDNRNRGMGFDGEMMPYCGRTFRVLRRVTNILNEKTGKMMTMKNPCIILDNVICEGRYSECRMFCPRAIYPYWREIWLERVEPPVDGRGG